MNGKKIIIINGKEYDVGSNRSITLDELSKEDLIVEVLKVETMLKNSENMRQRDLQEWRDLLNDGWMLEGFYNLRTYFKNLKGEDGKFFNRDEEDLYTSLLIIIERIYENVEHFDRRVSKHSESVRKYDRNRKPI